MCTLVTAARRPWPPFPHDTNSKCSVTPAHALVPLMSHHTCTCLHAHLCVASRRAVDGASSRGEALRPLGVLALGPLLGVLGSQPAQVMFDSRPQGCRYMHGKLWTAMGASTVRHMHVGTGGSHELDATYARICSQLYTFKPSACVLVRVWGCTCEHRLW